MSLMSSITAPLVRCMFLFRKVLSHFLPCLMLLWAVRQVMLASLMAAGTGINLTSANHCFICDREFGTRANFSNFASLHCIDVYTAGRPGYTAACSHGEAAFMHT